MAVKPGPTLRSRPSVRRVRAQPGLLVVPAIALFFVTRAYILFAFEPLASDAPPDPASILPARARYMQTFRALMCACDVAAFALFAAIVRRRHPARTNVATVAYTVATALLADVLYDRLDCGLLLLFMATAYAWLRGADPAAGSPRWITAAYVCLGLGIAYKIVPIVALPFLLLAEWRHPDGARRVVRALIVTVIAAALPFLWQTLESGWGVFQLVLFHAGRGIQLESLWATLMAVAGPAGAPVRAVLWTGGVNLTSAIAPVVLWLSTAALVAFVGGLAIWSARRHAFTRDDAFRALCLAVAGAVILAKVLSPQYFVWALPLTLLLALEVLDRSRRGLVIACVTVVAIAGLTAWVFPHHYFSFKASRFGLESPEDVVLRRPIDPSFVLLGLRNVAYFVLVAALGVRLLMPRAPV